MESLGERLAKLRNEKGMTQRQVAAIFHVSRPLVAYWEDDKRRPSLDQLSRLAELYSCTTDYLLGRGE